jgi:Kef-type K+ transport system membrane component KefB
VLSALQPIFPVFMGVAMSISALPVIVRILIDLNLQKTELAATIVAAAVIDNFLGWGVFAPIYFASIGLSVNFAQNFLPGLTAVIFGVACVGKIIGAGFGAWLGDMRPREALAVGFGMNARGAMEIVLAALALKFHVITEPVFVALVVMALLTSALSGPVIARLFRCL